MALIQGIFGIGGEAFGPICMATSSHEEAMGLHHRERETPLWWAGLEFLTRPCRWKSVWRALWPAVDDADLSHARI